MIKGYKQQKVLKQKTQTHAIIKVTKNGKQYLMDAFDQINDSDQYTFRIRKKLKCSHVVPLVDEFEEDDTKYYVSQYMDTDLLMVAHQNPGHVLQLHEALYHFARLMEVIEQLHANKLIYRNIRPEKIRIKDKEPYLYDFSLSQFMKRKQRLFDLVGVGSFLAPQYFSDDGYGAEVDIWAAGVLLFYLLIKKYPFNFKGNMEADFKAQFLQKCGEGFKFSRELQDTHFNSPPLKGNKALQDFFKRIFHPNPAKRLTISQIKQHPIMEGHFAGQMDPEMLAVIKQNGRESSIFLSQMYKFPCSKILHKEEVILDFIEETSELFLLECPQIYEEQLRYKSQFAVLKVGLIKTRDLKDITFGKKDPFFKVTPQEWQAVRNSSALTQVRQKLQKKDKILRMIYKNAFLNVKHLKQKDPFFCEQLPEHFQNIKISYRGTLSEMFEIGRKSLAKAKGNRRLSRKLTQSLVRVIILFLVNRLFESQQQIQADFPQYLAWSKTKDLQDLQDWIQSQQLANLKMFMKAVTSKYL